MGVLRVLYAKLTMMMFSIILKLSLHANFFSLIFFNFYYFYFYYNVLDRFFTRFQIFSN